MVNEFEKINFGINIFRDQHCAMIKRFPRSTFFGFKIFEKHFFFTFKLLFFFWRGGGQHFLSFNVFQVGSKMFEGLTFREVYIFQGLNIFKVKFIGGVNSFGLQTFPGVKNFQVCKLFGGQFFGGDQDFLGIKGQTILVQ